jgi:LysR family hydrogen peroxide-inducible transcriptional activator
MLSLRRLPSLTQMRHLVALAEHRHFGRAAAACFVTQSTLSASIKELESLLGEVLIERTRRMVMPTPLGLTVVDRARKVLTGAEEIVDMVAAAGVPLSGSLRLGVIPTIAPFLLPRVLPALRRDHTGLQLYLREDTSARLVAALKGGELDLALLAFPYDLEGLESEIFAEDPFQVALPGRHELAGRRRLRGRDLIGQELLLLEEGHCLRDQIIAAGVAAPAGQFQASSLHTIVQMVDSGLGLTLLPEMAVAAGLTRGTEIEMRPLQGAAFRRHIGFAWRPSSPRRADFVLLSEYFRLLS